MNFYVQRITILLIFIALVIAGCSSDQSDTGKSGSNKNDNAKASKAKGKTISIGWVYAMANAPVLIADKKGYFKEQGINVELYDYTSGPRVRQGLKSGKLDMAFIGAPPVYHWYSRGLDSKIIAKVNYGQASVLVRSDSGIDDVSGLKGKKLAGVRTGSGMDVLLRGYVLREKAKLDPNKDLDVRPMKPGNMGTAVENKVVSGAFVWEPFTSKYLLRGNTKIILDINKEIPQYPWYVVMAMPKAMKNKRPEIVKVLKAHIKAVKFLNSSPTAGNNIITEAFDLREVVDKSGNKHSPEKILSMARTRLGWQAELTATDIAFVQRLMNYSRELGYIQKDLKASELIDNSFMNEAKGSDTKVSK